MYERYGDIYNQLVFSLQDGYSAVQFSILQVTVITRLSIDMYVCVLRLLRYRVCNRDSNRDSIIMKSNHPPTDSGMIYLSPLAADFLLPNQLTLFTQSLHTRLMAQLGVPSNTVFSFSTFNFSSPCLQSRVAFTVCLIGPSHLFLWSLSTRPAAQQAAQTMSADIASA